MWWACHTHARTTPPAMPVIANLPRERNRSCRGPLARHRDPGGERYRHEPDRPERKPRLRQNEEPDDQRRQRRDNHGEQRAEAFGPAGIVRVHDEKGEHAPEQGERENNGQVGLPHREPGREPVPRPEDTVRVQAARGIRAKAASPRFSAWTIDAGTFQSTGSPASGSGKSGKPESTAWRASQPAAIATGSEPEPRLAKCRARCGDGRERQRTRGR